MSDKLLRWVTAPANWCGLGLASGVLGLQAAGLLGTWGVGIAALGYAAGFALGGVWFGFPSAREAPWEALQFSDEGDAREAMSRALKGVRALTENNPGSRIPAAVQTRIFTLCEALESLLDHWERSKGSLSLQDSFHARHIAISYLPDALNTYLSIPANFATGKLLENGKTAAATFNDTLADLEAKVQQLQDDLAAQDAQAFLLHSRFLNQKFGRAADTELPIESGGHK